MKSKDWAAIAGIVIVAAIFSFAIASLLLGGKEASKIKVEVVDPISADFPLPNKKYFNENSVNPTQVINIGEDNNQTPFDGQ